MSNNPNPTGAQAQQQLQTLVVHRDQLTSDNLIQLGQAGYNIVTDPALFIFGRYIKPSENKLVALPSVQQTPDTQDAQDTPDVSQDDTIN